MFDKDSSPEFLKTSFERKLFFQEKEMKKRWKNSWKEVFLVIIYLHPDDYNFWEPQWGPLFVLRLPLRSLWNAREICGIVTGQNTQVNFTFLSGNRRVLIKNLFLLYTFWTIYNVWNYIIHMYDVFVTLNQFLKDNIAISIQRIISFVQLKTRGDCLTQSIEVWEVAQRCSDASSPTGVRQDCPRWQRLSWSERLIRSFVHIADDPLDWYDSNRCSEEEIFDGMCWNWSECREQQQKFAEAESA